MKLKKFLSIILSVLLIICIAPFGNVTTDAATSGYYTYYVTNGEAAIYSCDDSISGDVVIPSVLGDCPVTSINTYAFNYCESITSITIPDGVTKIGREAFASCTGLTSVIISESVESLGKGVFKDCTSLTSVTFSDGLLSIGESAFYNCTSLTNITLPDSLMEIEKYAFQYCSNLESITVPDSVKSIGYWAFGDCTSLSKVYITDIGAWCNIDFESYYSNPISHAGNLYLNGKFTTKLVIPDSVESIGNLAFCGYTNLTSIILPDSITSIGKWAFEDCTSLRNITIPDGVTSIGDSAFNNCSSLTGITIPDGVTSLGNWVFEDCTRLESISLSENVTSIGDRAFYRCSNLISITIPDSVTSIGEWAFHDCIRLESVTIGKGVISIGDLAFKNCQSLKSVTIPDSVTIIGNNAFLDCTSLESITIGKGVTSIGYSVFNSCNVLKRVNIADIEAFHNIEFTDSYSNPMRCAGYLYLNNQLVTDLEVQNDTQTIEQDEYNNYKCIENVFIPKSVVLIKQNAFYNCIGLKNVYFEGNAEEWAELSILSGNDYLTNANVYFNCTEIPKGISEVKITKLPTKIKYIENEEDLDLAGGVLTVYYDGGATLDIDLATLNVSGFDNSVLGIQTITVVYGEYSAKFEVEIVSRPIEFIAVTKMPLKLEYIKGEVLDLTGGKFTVVYPEGNFATFDITAEMIADYNPHKTGKQILTVDYRGYTDIIVVTVYANSDINGDGVVNASDLVCVTKLFLNNTENTENYDINGDGETDIRDFVALKNNIAENND